MKQGAEANAESRIRANRWRYWLRRIGRGRWLPQSTTSYRGEFGHELKSVLPYAYWLHRQGRLRRTVSTMDTRCFYFFSPQHVERQVTRAHIPVRDFPVFDAHTGALDRSRWIAPPLGDAHANARFVWAKPTLVISNKFSSEWGGPPINYLDVPTLRELLSMLSDRYCIVYNRPGAGEHAADHQSLLDLGEDDMIAREFPDVIRLPALWRSHPDVTFNTLQCMVYANCRRFISVQGGGSVLASYFGGRNVIFVREGAELREGSYAWYDALSGCDVMPAGDRETLVSTVRRAFADAV